VVSSVENAAMRAITSGLRSDAAARSTAGRAFHMVELRCQDCSRLRGKGK
jgi:hypothetical protein